MTDPDEQSTHRARPSWCATVDYDRLTVAEVTAVLPDLAAVDLAEVVRRERSGKNRVTVLRRVEALQRRTGVVAQGGPAVSASRQGAVAGLGTMAWGTGITTRLRPPTDVAPPDAPTLPDRSALDHRAPGEGGPGASGPETAGDPGTPPGWGAAIAPGRPPVELTRIRLWMLAAVAALVLVVVAAHALRR